MFDRTLWDMGLRKNDFCWWISSRRHVVIFFRPKRIKTAFALYSQVEKLSDPHYPEGYQPNPHFLGSIQNCISYKWCRFKKLTDAMDFLELEGKTNNNLSWG